MFWEFWGLFVGVFEVVRLWVESLGGRSLGLRGEGGIFVEGFFGVGVVGGFRLGLSLLI